MKDDLYNPRVTVRMPQPLRERIRADAQKNGRTENAEILSRLSETPAIDLLHQLLRENAELKALVKQLSIDRA